MVTTKKTIRSVCISNECEELIKENFKYGEFGKWIEETLFNTFTSSREKLEKELKETKLKIEKIECELKKQYEVDIKEVEYMKSANERILRDPSFIKGILNEYRNLFGKAVTRDYFLKRMEILIRQ